MLRTRRLLAVIATAAIATVATLTATTAPAHAAASGFLLIKGSGSVYTANEVVNLGVTPGTSKTWGIKVVNTGPTSQQFKITISPSSPSITPTLLLGSTPVPRPYYTVPIAPGGSILLNLKLQLAAGVAPGQYWANVGLVDPESNLSLDSTTADANATYQSGNTRNGLYVKTGTQPYVGGTAAQQFETATALKPGNIATFILRLRNDGGSPAAINLNDLANNSCAANFSVTIKEGTKNVTAAVEAGTYTTGVLAPGARKELKLMVKLLTAATCTGVYYGFVASGADGSNVQYAHVVTGV